MLVLTYDPTRNVVPYSESKWLVLTSSLFLIPAIHCWNHELYGLFYFSVANTVISINYWKNARFSWERMLDWVFAKVLAVLLIINGIMNATQLKYIMLGYPCLFLALYCYYKSTTQIGAKWVKYHVAFHLFTVCSKFIVINAILNNKQTNQEKCFYLC